MRLTISIPSGYSIVAGKQQLRTVMRQAGNEVAAQARARGALVEPIRVRAKSIKARPWKSGEGVTIVDVAFYALFLEKGAKGGGGDTHKKANILLAGEKNWRGKVLRTKNRMKASAINRTRVLLPHPFLQPALDYVAGKGLANRVRDAVISGMAFQKGK